MASNSTSLSMPEQISKIANQLLLLSRSLEEVKQRWQQDNSQAETLRTELNQARELNHTLQTQKESLQARLSKGKSGVASQTLGRILHEDVARANARLAHAQRHDLISDTDVDVDHEEKDFRNTTLPTERGRGSDRVSYDEEERGIEGMLDDYISPSGPYNTAGGSQSATLGPSNGDKRTEQKATDRSSTSTAKRQRVYHEMTSVRSTSTTLPSELATESFSTRSDTPQWKVHIQKPPTSSRVTCGPMKSSHLSKKLNFDEETAVSFKGLLSGSDDLKLNLRIHGDLAFIYDPIFLEDATIPATYLFDWGRPDDNETILSYIQTKSSQNDSVFHTFVYILRTKRWYYVGAQKWTQTSLRWDVWESFDDIRSRLIQRLHDHCGTILERETIAEMLENGDLQQICIHISGDGHIDTSRTMCKTLGYDSPSE